MNVTMYTTTRTSMAYRPRITVELAMHSAGLLLNAFLCVFFALRSHLLFAYKPTIVFVTFGSLLLNLPLLLYELFLVVNLWAGIEPTYSVFVKNLTSSTTSCSQVLPFAVSIYRYRTVVRNRKPTFEFVLLVQLVVTVVFVIIAFLNIPLGHFDHNDQCEVFHFSQAVEVVRIFFTLGLNMSAITINLLVFLFVKRYGKENAELQRRRVGLTSSLLIQSLVPVVVSIPLLLISLEFYFGIQLPEELTYRWYVLTYFGPFLTPFSSMVSLRRIRRELLSCSRPRQRPKRRATTIFTDSDYNSS